MNRTRSRPCGPQRSGPIGEERPRAPRASFAARCSSHPTAVPLAADLHSELGLCLSAQVRPGAADLLADAVELAATPEQRVRIALSGSRALGMAGHFDRAIELCRLGLDQPIDAAAQLRGSLELEMACGMLLSADTVDEGLELARRHAARR